jgi:hypothetical protein
MLIRAIFIHLVNKITPIAMQGLLLVLVATAAAG